MGPLRPPNSSYTSSATNTCMASYMLEKQCGLSNGDCPGNQNFQIFVSATNELLTWEQITTCLSFRFLFPTRKVGKIAFALLPCKVVVRLKWDVLKSPEYNPIIPMRCLFILGVERKTGSQMDINRITGGHAKGQLFPSQAFWPSGTPGG